MKTEKDKMLGGELYDPQDPQLTAARRRARLLLKELNDSRAASPGRTIPASASGTWGWCLLWPPC